MGSTRKPVQITHEELQIALRKFQRKGGIIRKLPDERVHTQRAVASPENREDLDSRPDPAP